VYDVRGMLEKNRDTFRDDVLNLLRESRFVVHRQARSTISLSDVVVCSCLFQFSLYISVCIFSLYIVILGNITV